MPAARQAPTDEEVKATYEAVVADYPDARNPAQMLYNWITHEPCCVVGHVFHRLGFTPKDYEGYQSAFAAARKLGLSPTAVDFLVDVQDVADGGRAGGEFSKRPRWADIERIAAQLPEEDEDE